MRLDKMVLTGLVKSAAWTCDQFPSKRYLRKWCAGSRFFCFRVGK